MKMNERLREFGKLNFATVNDFAAALNMQAPSLHKYLKGDRAPGADILLRLRELGCDINWLLTGIDKTGKVDERADDRRAWGYYVTSLVGAGSITPFDDDREKEVVFFPIKSSTAEALKVVGNSMEPTVMSGDYILADKTDHKQEGVMVVLVKKNGEQLLRRWIREDVKNRFVVVLPDNGTSEMYKMNEIREIYKVLFVLKRDIQ